MIPRLFLSILSGFFFIFPAHSASSPGLLYEGSTLSGVSLFRTAEGSTRPTALLAAPVRTLTVSLVAQNRYFLSDFSEGTLSAAARFPRGGAGVAVRRFGLTAWGETDLSVSAGVDVSRRLHFALRTGCDFYRYAASSRATRLPYFDFGADLHAVPSRLAVSLRVLSGRCPASFPGRWMIRPEGIVSFRMLHALDFTLRAGYRSSSGMVGAFSVDGTLYRSFHLLLGVERERSFCPVIALSGDLAHRLSFTLGARIHAVLGVCPMLHLQYAFGL